jgi:hypothetical protein
MLAAVSTYLPMAATPVQGVMTASVTVLMCHAPRPLPSVPIGVLMDRSYSRRAVLILNAVNAQNVTKT